MNKALEFYNEKIKKIENDMKTLKGKIKVLSIIRLLIFLATIILAYFSYKSENIILMISEIVAGILVFIIIAYIHNEKINLRDEKEAYLYVNKKGLSRINGTFKDFIEDKGDEFIDDKHGFTNDLDVFGRNSIFQMINSTKTIFGRKILSETLSLKKLPKKDEIIRKQDAVEEISKRIEFRQMLEVKSSLKDSGKKDISELLKWANSEGRINKIFEIVPYIFIIKTIIVIAIIVLGKLRISVLILDLCINYIAVKLLTKKLVSVIGLFENHKKDIEAYRNILEIIEKEKFESLYINEIKDKLRSKDSSSAYTEFKVLKNLVDWIGDSTGNAYYLLLNVILLSDVFILNNLEKWKIKNGYKLENWLKVIGEIESLASISNISFDFETWNYAKFTDESIIVANNIGHPILGERAVTNSFTLNNNKKAGLITGSNMSGKSTFLRTLGLNLLLSYIGGKSYCNSLNCGIFNIYTCMRTKDNLEESISSFYAEILRIKIVIEAAKEGEKVLFLLDEIFKGTNSKDRHEGAKVLIEQLVESGGIGLVSTHDLELCDLEKTKPWIINYNFQEYYKDDKINFDYKLRDGKSKTQNAMHLMKLAGIDFK